MNILVLYAAIVLAVVTFAARLLAWRYHVRQVRRRRERRPGYLPIHRELNHANQVYITQQDKARRASLYIEPQDFEPVSDPTVGAVQDWTPKR